MKRFEFYEFFAGGGMARLGLGPRWRCTMANDICEKKAATYRENFPHSRVFIKKDVAELRLSDLPGKPVLAWASFPCQDLSLAGDRRGLAGHRSGTFWPFWDLISTATVEHPLIPIVVLENVVGALTSHGGKDLEAILWALYDAGYCFGPLVIDAVHFVPQSRPRLFIVAALRDRPLPLSVLSTEPTITWHPESLRKAYEALPAELREWWVWWNLPVPQRCKKSLSDIIEKVPIGVDWHSPTETERLISLMSEGNRRKVEEAQQTGQQVIGTIYKRTRPNGNGTRSQRAEVRFDQISGCLRTPIGGSSRQTVLIVKGSEMQSRLLSPREAARLMGVKDNYKLPSKYNEAYHLMGDGLVVPAVSWLERHILFPLAETRVAERARTLTPRRSRRRKSLRAIPI